MVATFTYRRASELPALLLPWQYQTSADTWADLDLSSGYTLTATLTSVLTGTVTSVTAPIGALGSVTITWAVDDLDLTPGVYQLKVKAVENATSKDRWWNPGGWPLIKIVG